MQCPLKGQVDCFEPLQELSRQAQTSDPTWHVRLAQRDVIDDAVWDEVPTLSPAPHVDIHQHVPRCLCASSQAEHAEGDDADDLTSSTYWLYSFPITGTQAREPPADAETRAALALPSVGILVQQELPELERFEVYVGDDAASDAAERRNDSAYCQVTKLGQAKSRTGLLKLSHGVLQFACSS